MLSKKTTSVCIFSLVLIICAAFFQRHLIASVTIGYSNFIEISPNLFVDGGFLAEDRLALVLMLEEARERVAAKYGEVIAKPVIIVSSSMDKAARFQRNPESPATTRSLPWHQYIVISPSGSNVDVISHELVHAEVYHRLGYIAGNWRIPMWFNEGLAMQVDYRQSKAWSYIQEGRELPPLTSIESVREFHRGETAPNYAAAKLEISAWLALNPSLDLYGFLENIRAGGRFQQLYDGMEDR